MPEHNSYINYDVFDPELIPLDKFSGPKVGEKAVEFEAVTTDGTKVALSDFLGRTVVLEMGSYTCPMHSGDIDAMNLLLRKYPEVVFLVLYIREAHPGGKISGHVSMRDKIALARRLEENPNENRLVLVDDVEGSTHRLYGVLPNSVHVINAKGFTAFRSDWNNVVLVDRILAELKENDDAILEIEHFPKKPQLFSKDGIPVLRRGGWRAIWDMVAAVPRMIKAHKRASAAYPEDRTFRG
jgi:peroxiredoxin